MYSDAKNMSKDINSALIEVLSRYLQAEPGMCITASRFQGLASFNMLYCLYYRAQSRNSWKCVTETKRE